MTTNELKQVMRLLKEAYKELEQEVSPLEEGYDQLQALLREKILARLGYTVEEYREAKAQLQPARKKKVVSALQKTKAELEEKTTDIESRLDELTIPTEEDIKNIAQQFVKEPQIINQIVKETTIEKPTIVEKTINQITREEYDDGPVWAELGYLAQLVENLPQPTEPDYEMVKEEIRNEFGDWLEKNINILNMPDFRKLAMGLQDQVDQAKAGISNLVTVSGNYSVKPSDHTVVVDTVGTLTLPAGVNGKVFHIKNMSVGTITVTAPTTIDNETNQYLYPLDGMQVQFNGTQYIII